MLTRKKIEKLWGSAYSEHKNEGGYDALVMFARLVEAEVLANASHTVAGEVAHDGRVMLNCELLQQRASAARRAAKESR